jgi:hypothetical protein
LLDYEDDPTTLEHAQMADIEKKVEERAAKLLDDKVVTLPGTKEDVGVNSRLSNNFSNKSGEESDNMDWGSALDAFGSYKDKEFEKAIEKLSAKEGVRRSARTKGNIERIQSMAEALKKKKKNEPSGNTHSTPVFASQLATVAAACNIYLGNSPNKIEASISSFHANEMAMAVLHAAKKECQIILIIT